MKTFDNFIVSACNEKAYRASINLINNPQSQFLVLYGPTTCGKTHLLSAIERAFRNSFPSADAYVSTYDDVISKYIKAIQEGKQNQYNKDICKYDLLILDNMQFLAGKSHTQEEIAERFSDMLYAGKTVIVAFDRPIKYYEKMIRGIRFPNPEKTNILKMEPPDEFLRSQYLDMILKETQLTVPSFIKKKIIFSDSLSLASFRGYVFKLQLYQEQKGISLTDEDMMICLLDYTQEV